MLLTQAPKALKEFGFVAYKAKHALPNQSQTQDEYSCGPLVQQLLASHPPLQVVEACETHPWHRRSHPGSDPKLVMMGANAETEELAVGAAVLGASLKFEQHESSGDRGKRGRYALR